MKQKIKRILDYLEDEDKHFWENCQCSEDIQRMQFPHLCTCEENKNHIFRDVECVTEWLNSPSCPLVDSEDYCTECKKYVDQIDLGDGEFGCPSCRRADCIEIR